MSLVFAFLALELGRKYLRSSIEEDDWIIDEDPDPINDCSYVTERRTSNAK